MRLILPSLQILSVWLPAFYLFFRWLPLAAPGRLAFCLGASGILALVASGALLWLGLKVTGQLLVWLPASLLILAALASAILTRHRRTPRAPAAPVQPPSGGLAQVLIIVLTALIALRVLSLLPDVVLRPLFAWDAWTVWGYEARVWLETGGHVDFLPPGEWLNAPAERFLRDTLVPYPKLIPALILWTVPADAAWTGVGPGLLWLALLGFIALVIAGTVRLAGAGMVWALTAAYLFISLPLVNAHVALYGYADLWLAGVIAVFAGLLVLAGHDGRKRWLLMALPVLGLLPLIKVEGSYWLILGIAATGAAHLGTRTLVGMSLVGVIAVMLAAAQGLDPLALATAGRLSVEADGLGVALTGAARHAFVWFDWHLLVYLSLAVLILLLWRPALADRLQALTAFCLFGLVLLWGFTPLTGAGQFLSQGTLFSRIILQFAPALILLVVLVGQRIASGAARPSAMAMRHAVPAMLMSAIVLWAGWTAWAMTDAGARTLMPAQILAPEAARWRMVEGQGELTDQGFRVTAPGLRGRALLAVELPVELPVTDYNRIELKFRSAVPGQLALSWSLHRQFHPDIGIPAATTGDASTIFHVGGERRWQAPVYFLAIEQMGFIDGPWTLESIVLHPGPVGFGRIQRILLDSLHVTSAWAQRDPHFLWPVGPATRISVVLAVALWFALTALLLWLFTQRCDRRHMVWLALPLCLAWLMLDLRWQIELTAKARATVASFAGQQSEERFAADLDGELFEFLHSLRQAHRRSDFNRVFAFSEVEFWRKRARYHLAAWDVRPAAANRLNPVMAAQLQHGDLLLLLRLPGVQLLPPEQPADATQVVLTDAQGQPLLIGQLVGRDSDWLAVRMVSLAP